MKHSGKALRHVREATQHLAKAMTALQRAEAEGEAMATQRRLAVERQRRDLATLVRVLTDDCEQGTLFEEVTHEDP